MRKADIIISYTQVVSIVVYLGQYLIGTIS